MVIGKAENPRCFHRIEKRKLPVTWRANRKAWMTSNLFIDWVNGVNLDMRRQKRKILLFIDNAPSHPDIDLSNVTIKFFPPNATSHLQPLDQGIIRAFKAHYRRYVLERLLRSIETINSIDEITRQLSVLDVVGWINSAWKNVTEK